MNIKIALPGDKYYAVPVEVIEKYSISQSEFEKKLNEEESIFDEPDVTGQGCKRGEHFCGSVAMGVRG